MQVIVVCCWDFACPFFSAVIKANAEQHLQKYLFGTSKTNPLRERRFNEGGRGCPVGRWTLKTEVQSLLTSSPSQKSALSPAALRTTRTEWIVLHAFPLSIFEDDLADGILQKHVSKSEGLQRWFPNRASTFVGTSNSSTPLSRHLS